jgi:hypothetical protein
MSETINNGEYEYQWVAVPKQKRRFWKCKCGTELISKPLDIDTFDRIPNFKPCPICRDGELVKEED